MRSGIGNSASDPIFVQGVAAGGTLNPAGTVADPFNDRIVGSTSIAVSQAASSISPANATQIVAARAGRGSVILTNITGAQPVYIVASAVGTGVTTGFMIPAVVGASITIPTAAALFATSPTAGQTVGILETF